jgi:hypothetical protein
MIQVHSNSRVKKGYISSSSVHKGGGGRGMGKRRRWGVDTVTFPTTATLVSWPTPSTTVASSSWVSSGDTSVTRRRNSRVSAVWESGTRGDESDRAASICPCRLRAVSQCYQQLHTGTTTVATLGSQLHRSPSWRMLTKSQSRTACHPLTLSSLVGKRERDL